MCNVVAYIVCVIKHVIHINVFNVYHIFLLASFIIISIQQTQHAHMRHHISTEVAIRAQEYGYLNKKLFKTK